MKLFRKKKFVFRRKEEQATGKMHDEELHILFSSLPVIRMNKSRSMIWTGYVTRMRKKRNACKILARKSDG
jgi:hypothetical protein